jgi:hypothetical protein
MFPSKFALLAPVVLLLLILKVEGKRKTRKRSLSRLLLAAA